jgi:carnitine O-acetyltransferase
MSAVGLDDPQLTHLHSLALREALVSALSFHTAVRTVTPGGRKARLVAGVSPDALVSLSLSLAFTRTFQRFPVVYETASTRRFFRGRTEAGRPATVAAARFIAACGQVPSWPAVGERRAQLRALGHAAASAHVATMRAASAGTSFDRHLLALRSLTPTLPLWSHPLLSFSLSFSLSTSNVSVGRHWVGGFAPVAPHGVGVGFSVRDEFVFFICSAKRDSGKGGEEWADEVVRAYRDVSELLGGGGGAKL